MVASPELMHDQFVRAATPRERRNPWRRLPREKLRIGAFERSFRRPATGTSTLTERCSGERVGIDSRFTMAVVRSFWYDVEQRRVAIDNLGEGMFSITRLFLIGAFLVGMLGCSSSDASSSVAWDLAETPPEVLEQDRTRTELSNPFSEGRLIVHTSQEWRQSGGRALDLESDEGFRAFRVALPQRDRSRVNASSRTWVGFVSPQLFGADTHLFECVPGETSRSYRFEGLIVRCSADAHYSFFVLVRTDPAFDKLIPSPPLDSFFVEPFTAAEAEFAIVFPNDETAIVYPVQLLENKANRFGKGNDYYEVEFLSTPREIAYELP